MVRLEQICKSYVMGESTVEALRGIDLTLERGQYVSIVGPSGSGKSTLMHIMGCLDTPTYGEYYLNGVAVKGLKRNELAKIRNKDLGFVFQNFNLLGHATALNNVELPLIYQAVARRFRRERAIDLLKRVGLSDRINHLPSELSGGQRQRVAVARALAADPQLILADEPTGNLDSASGEEIVGLLKELVTEGKTVVVVTHDMQVARQADTIISLKDGAIDKYV